MVSTGNVLSEDHGLLFCTVLSEEKLKEMGVDASCVPAMPARCAGMKENKKKTKQKGSKKKKKKKKKKNKKKEMQGVDNSSANTGEDG